ncbi:unnamed protein product (mitochondrion) [Plasmodiophora brassicae]|uniref:Cullin family profile domain-containing protein n=1 Tax=Plasmodiophora brassicae TaxID=37360 RepID=A0A0G4J6M5_PLABS|nr:hypothetical protein PBRA_009262 [Plasmodiophora brassicae]SPR01642.1 unnamed protein product [Plasmodiophora brassicae]
MEASSMSCHQHDRDVEHCWNAVVADVFEPVCARLADVLGEADGPPVTADALTRLYSQLYDLCCVHNGVRHCSAMYRRLELSLQTCTSTIISVFEECGRDQLLQAFNVATSLYRGLVRAIAVVMRYVDQHHGGPDRRTDSKSICWQMYLENVYDVIEPTLTDLLCETLQSCRQDSLESEVTRHLQMAIHSIFEIDPTRRRYKAFESKVFQRMVRCYQRRARQIAELPLHDSIRAMHDLFVAEKAVFASTLQNSLLSTFEEFFRDTVSSPNRTRYFGDHMSSEVADLVSSVHSSSLSMLYEVYGKDPSSRGEFADFIQETIVKKGRDAQAMWKNSRQRLPERKRPDGSHTFDAVDMALIESYISLFNEAALLSHRVFLSDPFFISAIRKGLICLFSDALPHMSNVSQSPQNHHLTSTEILANYANVWLHKRHPLLSNQFRTHQEVESVLSVLGDLFAMSPDHDLFMTVYSKQLAERLLTSSSVSLPLETSIIDKFKLRAGARYTSRLDGMVMDINKSMALSASFKSSLSHQTAAPNMNAGGVPIHVKLLTRGFWVPAMVAIPDVSNLVLPSVLRNAAVEFAGFYSRVHERRVLYWKHQYGDCRVAMKCCHPAVDLTVSTLQACVLVLFNKRPFLSLPDICQELRIEEELGHRILHSLVIGRFKVLRAHVDKPFISASDTFTPNYNLETSYTRVRLPSPYLLRESQLHPQQDNTVAVQAAIVRILKRAKSIQHDDLVDEVVALLQRFRVTHKAVASRIQYLVENEFIERDGKDPDMYHFIP